MTPTQQIDSYIVSLEDWRGEYLSKLRLLIHEVDPEIIEEWKWETPVFSHNGSVCAISAFKEHVKINFFKGASLNDPQGLFNNGLDSKHQRAIDIREDEKIDEESLKSLIRDAIVLNTTQK